MVFYRIRSKEIRSRRKRRIQQKCSQQRTDIDSLSNELDKVRIEKQTLNKWAQDQISILEKKLQSSMSASEYDGLLVQIKSLKASLRKKLKQGEEMDAQILHLKKVCAANEKKHQSKAVGIKSVQDTLQAEIDELKSTISQQGAHLTRVTELEAAQLTTTTELEAAHNTRTAQLEAVLTAEHTRITELEQALSAAEDKTQASRDQQKAVELAFTSKCAMVDELMEQLHKAKEDDRTLRERLEAVEKFCERQHVEKEQLRKKKHALEEELIQAENFLKTSQGESISRIEKELAASRLDYAQASSDLDDRNDEVEDLREDLEEERQHNEHLRSELQRGQGSSKENADPNTIGASDDANRSFVSKLFRR